MDIKKIGGKFLLISTLLFFLATAAINGQSRLFVDASQQLTNFRFADSEGFLDKNYAPEYSGAYSVGYSYEFDFGLFLKGNTGMRKSGATLVYDASNYRWDLQFLNTEIGAGYQYPLGMFSPYICISTYYGYLLKANQRINNEDFDIIDSESMIRHDVGIIFTPGVNVNISDAIRIFGEVSFLRGLQNVEAESEGKTTFSYLLGTSKLVSDISGQVSTNIAYQFTVGLSFAIQ